MSSPTEIIFITGLSGSGKSTALDALEDIGFFCIDNLPTELIKKLIEIIEHSDISKLAIACDIRDVNISKLKDIKEWMDSSSMSSSMIFLEANKNTIIKRYEQTRRNHPLSLLRNIPLADAIEQEIAIMSQIKKISDLEIDTSSLSPTSLRRFIFNQFSNNTHMSITLISFGFKYGIPIESDNVFDVRFITNPYFIDEYKNTTGLDIKTKEFVLSQIETKVFTESIKPLIKNLIPLYEKEGKSYLTISIGCTGGKHRSVAIVEYIKEYIESIGFSVKTFHRDIER
jgi:UPF0042 nucleotide-binding protein